MATQNPIEQEGTYPLPEAQLDRFLMHVSIGYPGAQAEKEILELARGQARDELGEQQTAPVLVTQEQVFLAQRGVLDLFMAPALEDYVVQLVLASRDPGDWDPDMARLVSYGASPRALQTLLRAGRVRAMAGGRGHVLEVEDELEEIPEPVLDPLPVRTRCEDEIGHVGDQEGQGIDPPDPVVECRPEQGQGAREQDEAVAVVHLGLRGEGPHHGGQPHHEPDVGDVAADHVADHEARAPGERGRDGRGQLGHGGAHRGEDQPHDQVRYAEASRNPCGVLDQEVVGQHQGGEGSRAGDDLDARDRPGRVDRGQ